jgi:hypothetical protein
MNEFFDQAAAAFVEAAREQGVSIDPPKLDPKTADDLLRLSRDVAHTRERRFAPLFTYIAGLAAARLLAKKPQTNVVEYFNAVREKLNLQEESPSKDG